MKNGNVCFDQDCEPLVIGKATLDRILEKCRNGGDCIALYVFYYNTAKWQKTATVKATVKFCANGLNYSEDRIRRARQELEAEGLISTVCRKDKNGKVAGWYVEVKFLWGRKSTLAISQRVDSPEGGNPYPNAKENNSLNAKENNIRNAIASEKKEEEKKCRSVSVHSSEGTPLASKAPKVEKYYPDSVTDEAVKIFNASGNFMDFGRLKRAWSPLFLAGIPAEAVIEGWKLYLASETGKKYSPGPEHFKTYAGQWIVNRTKQQQQQTQTAEQDPLF